jgi:hypothetical protein
LPLARKLAMAAPASQLGAGEALVVLLTVESLLFAAFAVGAALTATSEFGRPLPTSGKTFAYLVFGAICLVAVGGAAAWTDAYLDHGVHSVYQAIEAAAILAGIVAQVAFAAWTAMALRHS